MNSLPYEVHRTFENYEGDESFESAMKQTIISSSSQFYLLQVMNGKLDSKGTWAENLKSNSARSCQKKNFL